VRLTVRHKLLLLLALSLTAALLQVAGVLTWMIGRQSEAAARQEAAVMLRDIGLRIDTLQKQLQIRVTALAASEDAAASLALLTDYASPENYQPLIYDEEKKKLARELAENTLSTETMAFDGNAQLVAYAARQDSEGVPQSIAITTWADGRYQLIGTAVAEDRWHPFEPASALPRDAKSLGLPQAPVAQLRRVGRTLMIEVVAPVTRLREGNIRIVGWIQAALPLTRQALNETARIRNMEATLLFSGDFDLGNSFGLKPADFARAPSLLQPDRESPGDPPADGAHYYSLASLPLVGNESAWLIAAMDRTASDAAKRNTQFAVFAVLIGSLLIAIPVAGWAGRRWISAPFDTLRAGVHGYTQGQIDTHIELHSGDEFEELAEEFNILAVALQVREIAIREAEERWQFALDSAGHGVWDWNPKTDEVYLSPAWKRMLGYADDELASSSEAWHALLHPDDLPRVQAAIKRHLDGESDLYRMTYRMRSRDGEYRWILAIGRLMQHDGQPLRMIGTHTDITEQRRTQDKLEQLMLALQQSESRYRGFFTESKAVMLLIDPADGRIIDANPVASTFYGYSHEELLALKITDINLLTHDEVAGEMVRALKENRDHFIFPHRLKDGTVRTVEVYSGPYHYQNRLVLYSIIHDITDRIEAERGMREAATVFSATSEAIMITDAAGIIKRVNPAFTLMTGYESAESVGQTPRLLKSGRHDNFYYEEMWSQLQHEGRWEGEVWNRRKNGEIFPVWQIISVVHDKNDKVAEYVSLFIDITQKKRSEAEIVYRANYDALTGLPNRNLLSERLGQAIKQARRESSSVAVMFVDLDFFKQVNDTLGHAIGDRLLQSVAERMRLCVRETDTIARLGGDEFVVLLADIESSAAAGVVAEKIISEMVTPFKLDGHEIHIGASIGITLFPDDGTDVETLFRNADLAMYRAKNAGRNNAQFFEITLTTEALERRSLENDLRGALGRGEFHLNYQPVIKLADGTVVGAEALLRWRHPQKGEIGPDQFVPVAEETGLIREIGAWVFAEGCRQLAAWQAAGHTLTLAINVSVRQLPEDLSVRHILTVIGQYNLTPRQIILEITEGVLLTDSPGMRDWFLDAGAAGLQLAIDDFGTGYSSLAYLKRFPVHHVKIDKSFVRDMATDSADRALVDAILAMAHSLGLSVVAEGVETVEQAELLRDRACELAQGYHYSRPITAEAFTDLLGPPRS
jgi:diguanylate cyclase (GGDEF)-like protein/PAS domain S-box-containing protein